MDIIIKGYLNRFVDEFDLDKQEESINFEKFCIYSVLKNELNFFDDNDLDQIIIGENKGIDAICLSINGNPVINIKEIKDLKISKRNFDATLYFIQSKTSRFFYDRDSKEYIGVV